MDLEKRIGFCLASQQIRKWIDIGKLIVPEGFEERKAIQPSSYDPCLGAEAFIIDTKVKGKFRPETSQSVYRALLELPGSSRRKMSLEGGQVLNVGYSYLIPLQEKVRLNSTEYVKSSPKSSWGRLFVNTRLVTDFTPTYDEASACYCCTDPMDLWLMVEPLAFNLIVYPGQTLNQLRFFPGPTTQLTPAEILDEYGKNPLLHVTDRDGREVPPRPIISDDGLQIHLNVIGDRTAGIPALKARRNPEPIDTSVKSSIDAYKYFEPMTAREKKIDIEHDARILIASKELLVTPAHLNAELSAHSHIGISGPLHFAGFIDNGFHGDLVFEIQSHEIGSMVLVDGMPISRVRYFRTEKPDILYGKDIGSHYQGQIGPKVAKFFLPFDFDFAAKNYAKLNRDVLVLDARTIQKYRNAIYGFEPISEKDTKALMRDIKEGFFQSRYDCEDDELILQPIPYLVLFGPGGTIFTYIRADNIEDYGDTRLHGKVSIGVGGHVVRGDAPMYIEACLHRETGEEVELEGRMSDPKLAGTLVANDKPVDRVHAGLIYVAYTDGAVYPGESSIAKGSLMTLDEISQYENQETWTRILLEHYAELARYAVTSATESGMSFEGM